MGRKGRHSEEGAEMSRMRKKIIRSLALSIAVAAAMVPNASAGYNVGGADSSVASARTTTELGQAIGEPGEQIGAAANSLASRTPTELAQTVAPSVTAGAGSGGFDWGDAAIGAGTALGLALVGVTAVVFLNRRRAIRGSRVPVASS
jgi:hypothetical protein